MIVPEHRACDICGQPVYGDLNHHRVRKVYFEVGRCTSYTDGFKEYIRASDIDICEDCWGKMKEWMRQQLKEENGSD